MFISETLLMIVLGVGFLSIVVPIMVINWAKLIFEKTVSRTIVLSILTLTNSLGLLCLFLLVCGIFFKCSCIRYGNILNSLQSECVNVLKCRFNCFQRLRNICVIFFKCSCNTRQENMENNNQPNNNDEYSTQKITFFYIKLISLYIFGLCYLFHCGLYAWKHSAYDMLGFIYNIITILYVFFLLIFFSTLPGNDYTKTCGGKVVILIILISNVCIWMDTFFCESDILFERNIDVNNSSDIQNLTGTFSRAAEDAIEKTDPFFLPAMIEFSLMTIDMLFYKNENNIIRRNPRSIRSAIRGFCQLFIFIFCFILFSFTCTVLLTTTASNDTNYPEYFIVYESFQLFLKVLMLIFIILCIFPLYDTLTFHFSVSAFVLIFSCFGNIIYHVFCFLAFFSNKGPKVKESVTITCIENVLSVMLALLQIFFLLGIQSPNTIRSDSEEGCVYYLCSHLGTINLALWICDSIGEQRLPIFSTELNYAYGHHVWEIVNKLIFPLTIFFRFHTGLDFLKLYWERSS